MKVAGADRLNIFKPWECALGNGIPEFPRIHSGEFFDSSVDPGGARAAASPAAARIRCLRH
jgi:hypothetical protein